MHYKIYLFRHGQTYYNKSGRFTGDINSHLTSQGKKDAQKIAQKLKKVKIDYAFETRLSRSKETLQFVLRYHPECQKILTDDRMIERDYGTLQGRFHKTVIKEYGQKQYDTWHRSYDIKPPRGESVKDVEKRAEDFIVKEVLELKVEDGSYYYYFVTKKNWNTLDVVKEISQRLHVKDVGYAGLKDRIAVTSQY